MRPNSPSAWWPLAALLFASALALAGPTACGDDDGGIGTSAGLTRALEAAAPGDVIRLAGRELRGTFEVPAGVTVVGRSGTVVVAEGGAAFRLDSGGDRATELRDLTVETEAGAALVGILAAGDGAVALEGVTVRAAAGIGIASQGPASLTLTDVAIVGTLTDAFLARAAVDAFDPADVAVAGLAVAGGPDVPGGHRTTVSIAGLDIRDVAGFGAVFAGVGGEWASGGVSGVAGTGVLVEASQLTLVDVALHDVRKSPVVGALDLAFGLVVTEGSQVETQGLQVVRVDGFGVLQDASVGAHAHARVVANRGPGFWIQNAVAEPPAGADFALSESVVQGNGGVGVQLLDLRRAELRGTVVADTLGRPAISGNAGVTIVSDGVQVSTTRGHGALVTVDDLALFGNGRVGVLLDGALTEATTTSGGGPLTLCGNTAVGAEWTCTADADARRTCLRESGPIVGPDWSCTDGSDGTTCTTSAAGQLGGAPSAERSPTPAAGLPETEGCRSGVAGVIEGHGLVPGPALLQELDDGEGALPPAALDDAPTWECEAAGDVTTCVDHHADDPIRIDDRDNPGLVAAPGWECEDTAEGRRCAFGGNGLLARAGATEAVDVVDRADLVEQRDAAVVAAALQETDAFGVHSALATVCGGTGPCVGVAGRGVLGEAQLVGDDDGVVSGDGEVQAVLGQEGFERR